MQELITQRLDLWTSTVQTRSTAGRGRGGKSDSYGIKKLRELILSLAIQGKLFPQDNTWTSTTLGNLGTWAVGSGFPKTEQGKEGLDILFAKVSDMNLAVNEKYILTTNHTISEVSARRLGVNIHPSGTVVFPKIGGAIATNKRRILTRPTAIDNNCLGITPSEDVSTDWLYLVLSAIDFSKYQAGTSVPALSQGVLSKLSVGLPSLVEQKGIVAKVDELMTLCDQLEQHQTTSLEAHQTLVATLLDTLTRAESAADFQQAWQRIATHFDTLFTTEHSIDQLKQTILQLAVMGKLVPKPSDASSVDELLVSCDKKRALVAATDRRASVSPEKLLSKEQCWKIPNTWRWRALADLVNFIDYRGKTPEKKSSGVRLLTAKNVRPGRIDLSPEEFISEVDYKKWMTRGIPNPGDVLFTTEAPMGFAAVVDLKDRFALAQRTICFQGFGAIDPHFLALQFRSRQFQRILDMNATGMTAKGIKASKLKQLPIAIPTLEEQHRIVDKVDTLFALCESLSAGLMKAAKTQTVFADSLVATTINASA